MKKEIKKTSVEVMETYEAPKCEVMELQAEGMLCISGWDPDGGHENWGDEDNEGEYYSGVNSRRNR